MILIGAYAKVIITRSFLKWQGLCRTTVLLLVYGVKLLHKGRLFFIGGGIYFVDLIGLETEGVLGKAKGFLEFDGASMEATLLGDVEILIGLDVVLEDALAGAEFEYFTMHWP